MRIGCGAGFLNDRIDPAKELIEKGELDYVVFECLAERTLAIILKEMKKGKVGYAPTLELRMKELLPLCIEKDVRIITNMGAANPIMAGIKVAEISNNLEIDDLTIGIVTGDNISNILESEIRTSETGKLISEIKKEMLGAFVYLGAEPVLEALKGDADIVITGRVADASLFLGPMLYEFGWKLDDWDLLAKGVCIGHLLECGGQITGGYFADPPYKFVPNLARLGFPLAEVSENGDATITKVDGSGGVVTVQTCKEQLLYEVDDPSNYITPDVIADFTSVEFQEIERDKVKVYGARGKRRPKDLKVIIYYTDGYLGEGQISYGGSGAIDRASLAAEIIVERLKMRKIKIDELRIDYIGVNSLSRKAKVGKLCTPEVRLRVVGKTHTLEDAQAIGAEVEALYTNGPAGGGGVVKRIDELLGCESTLIPRDRIAPRVLLLKSKKLINKVLNHEIKRSSTC